MLEIIRVQGRDRTGTVKTTKGFSVLNNKLAISHHFQTLTHQPLPGTMLEYVGLCWVILGCYSYNMVTVLVTDWPELCNHPGRGRKDDATEFDVSLSLSQTQHFYRISIILARLPMIDIILK